MSKSYWDCRSEYAACFAISRLADDPSLSSKVRYNPQECRNLQNFLEKLDKAGCTLNEFEMLQTVVKAHHNDLKPAVEVILPWLVYVSLPRLQASHGRSQALEIAVDLLSSRFSAFVKEIADALPEVRAILPAGRISEARLNRLSVALQMYKEACSSNDNNYASQSIKELRRASENTNEDGCYTVLMKRIEVLEKKVQESRDSIESHQPFVMVEESAETARSQIMQDAAQEPSSGLETLSNASTSSTCTLTPATTVVNEPGEGSSNTVRDRVTLAATLELRVSVHFDDIVTVDSDGLEYYETPYPLVVRMHKTAPFKSLIDKLREKFGDHELRQKNSTLECIFESDTPASLNLETDDELIYALINDRVKTWDLTMW